ERAMTCYGWEHGTIELPSAEVAGIKRILRTASNEHREAVKERAESIHREVMDKRSTRSVDRYRETLREIQYGDSGPYRRQLSDRDLTVRATAISVISLVLDVDGKVRKPTDADIERVLPKATNRTTVFPVISPTGYPEASISIEGRTLTWDVPENNHSTDRAERSLLHGVLFGALDRIKWTRGSGGTIWGNNEYNESGNSPYGRGPDYVVLEYRYLSVKERAERNARMYRRPVSFQSFSGATRTGRRAGSTLQGGGSAAHSGLR